MDIDVSLRSEQRKFGLVMAGAFLVLGVIRWALHGFAGFPWLLASVAAVFLVIGLLVPGVLRPVLAAWLRLALGINWVMTRVILTLAFYGLITPVGIAIRLAGKDPLKREWKPEAASYWEDAEEQPHELERYRNQF